MPHINSQHDRLPDPLRSDVRSTSEAWSTGGKIRRLWDSDESLWTSSGEANWLGWLRVADPELARRDDLVGFASQVRRRASHVVVLGMGGSSLCPEVLRLCFGIRDGFPDLKVLDSTDPDQIRQCEDAIRIDSTIFLSASKSGSTIETSLLTQYFWDRLRRLLGAREAASRFVAITDPGSGLELTARELGFGHVFHGVPEIGGRYSALSNFGLVPAAAMGIDVDRLLRGVRPMRLACGPTSAAGENPGLQLGIVLGCAARAGRDKLTLLFSPRLAPLGTWIEQLVAESTGKKGKGIVPVDGESLEKPSAYGQDRVFVHTALEADADLASDSQLGELVRLGHPVVRIRLRELDNIGQEFFRWEFATAVASSVLGINPFDQPDVESAKVAARELTDAYEADGSLPATDPFLEESGIRVFASNRLAESLDAGPGGASLARVL